MTRRPLDRQTLDSFVDEIQKIGQAPLEKAPLEKTADLGAGTAASMAVLLKNVGFNHFAIHGHKYKPLQYLYAKAARRAILKGAEQGKVYHKVPWRWNKATDQVLRHVIDPRLGSGITLAKGMGVELSKRGVNAPKFMRYGLPEYHAKAEHLAKGLSELPDEVMLPGGRALALAAKDEISKRRNLVRFARTSMGEDIEKALAKRMGGLGEKYMLWRAKRVARKEGKQLLKNLAPETAREYEQQAAKLGVRALALKKQLAELG